MPPRTFVSPCTPYDLYEGSLDWNELTPVQQNRIICSHLYVQPDYEELVMESGWKKSQAAGLNSLIAGVSIVLDERLRLLNSVYREKAHASYILYFLAGTTIGTRLKQAHEGMIDQQTIIDIDPDSFEEVEECYDDLCDADVKEATELVEEMFGIDFDDLTHDQFTRLYGQGEVTLWTDNKRATRHWFSLGFKLETEIQYLSAMAVCFIATVLAVIYGHWNVAVFLIFMGLWVWSSLANYMQTKFQDRVMSDHEFFDLCKQRGLISFSPASMSIL